MPIYEYKCECGVSYEKLQAYTQCRDWIPCGHCGGKAERLKVNRTSFSLKGKGGYKDHYGLKEGK